MHTTAILSVVKTNDNSNEPLRTPAKFKDLNAVSITSIATVWTPASGKTVTFMGGSISVSAACNVLFEDNSAAAGNFLWRTPELSPGVAYNFYLGNGKRLTAADRVVKATASAAASITGTLYGAED